MEGKNTFIVRCGEVALKGMNKPYFERVLVERIRKALKKYDGADVRRQEGLIFVNTPEEIGVDGVIADISKVFGVASVSHAVEVESDIDAMP
jgi:thiamine biosynthesis protein ThiI